MDKINLLIPNALPYLFACDDWWCTRILIFTPFLRGDFNVENYKEQRDVCCSKKMFPWWWSPRVLPGGLSARQVSLGIISISLGCRTLTGGRLQTGCPAMSPLPPAAYQQQRCDSTGVLWDLGPFLTPQVKFTKAKILSCWSDSWLCRLPCLACSHEVFVTPPLGRAWGLEVRGSPGAERIPPPLILDCEPSFLFPYTK